MEGSLWDCSIFEVLDFKTVSAIEVLQKWELNFDFITGDNVIYMTRHNIKALLSQCYSCYLFYIKIWPVIFQGNLSEL